VKGVHGEKLRTPDLSQQPVLGIKEIPITGSCQPVRTGRIPSLVVVSCDAFPLQLSRIFPIYVETEKALRSQTICGEVKPISSSGLYLLATHFASIKHINALSILNFTLRATRIFTYFYKPGLRSRR